jgi:hypothetical protein
MIFEDIKSKRKVVGYCYDCIFRVYGKPLVVPIVGGVIVCPICSEMEKKDD